MAATQTSTTRDGEETVNTGNRQLAEVYAKALLGAGEKQGQAEALLAELDSLVVDVLDVYPKFEAMLGTAFISPVHKSELLARVFGSSASPLMMNFLRVLTEHDRLEILRDIRRVAVRLLDGMRGRVRVEVVTATPLDPDLTQRIAQQLQAALGREPRLVSNVDPSLLGGLLLRIGDTIFDGSVATRLARVREQMIERSVHEIQRGRDRFSYPAGN
jgi:F-type H+-transporting ATPase subunit delta